MAHKTQVSFDEALREYRALKSEEKRSRVNPQDYESVMTDSVARQAVDPTYQYCPTCGWRKGLRGWVRLGFPIGHPYFGMAFRCPRCGG